MQDFLASEASLILKGLMTRYGVTFRGLAVRLEALGAHEREDSLRNKINRGAFSFAFFLQCMMALGIDDVRFQLRGLPERLKQKSRGEGIVELPDEPE